MVRRRAKRNKRVVSQFEDLQQCYLRLRHRGRDTEAEQPDPSPEDEPSAAADERMPKRQRGVGTDGEAIAADGTSWSTGEGLNEFVRMLSVFTHCSRLRVRAYIWLRAISTSSKNNTGGLRCVHGSDGPAWSRLRVERNGRRSQMLMLSM